MTEASSPAAMMADVLRMTAQRAGADQDPVVRMMVPVATGIVDAIQTEMDRGTPAGDIPMLLACALAWSITNAVPPLFEGPDATKIVDVLIVEFTEAARAFQAAAEAKTAPQSS